MLSARLSAFAGRSIIKLIMSTTTTKTKARLDPIYAMLCLRSDALMKLPCTITFCVLKDLLITGMHVYFPVAEIV